MEKILICPWCGGTIEPMERLPGYYMCYICGLAVPEERARVCAVEVDDGEEA